MTTPEILETKALLDEFCRRHLSILVLFPRVQHSANGPLPMASSCFHSQGQLLHCRKLAWHLKAVATRNLGAGSDCLSLARNLGGP